MLQEIFPGLYSFKEQRFDRPKPLVIGVHPFYFRKHNPETKCPNKHYLGGIESLIKNHDGPVLILEEHPFLEKTARQIRGFERTDGVYFINTEENNPSPAELNWQEIFDSIDLMSNGKLQLFGGWYWPISHDDRKMDFRGILNDDKGLKGLMKKPIEKVITHDGCLGYFKAVLDCYKKHDVSVIEELTFK